MFDFQDEEEAKLRNEYFYTNQKQWLRDKELQIRAKDYLSTHYFQYLTEQIQNKTKDENIRTLFSSAIDILTRHCMTSRSFIRYSDDTKMEFYTYSIFRIFNYGLKTYDRNKSNAFVYMTSCINNGFKQVIKDDLKQKKLGRLMVEETGISGHITNISSNIINELEAEYLQTEEIQFDNMEPVFIQELKSKYPLKALRILNEDNVPRFQRAYTEFKYFIPVNDSGVVVEYIDTLKNNEDVGYSKTYYQSRLIKARENGYQTFFLYSDLYNNEDIEDSYLFKLLNDMILGISNKSQNMTAGYYYNSKMYYDPMISYIPKPVFMMKSLSEPIWYWLDYKRDNKEITISQSEEEYNKLKTFDQDGTRIYDCGKLII